MRNKANFLVKFLEDESELKREFVFGTENGSKRVKGQFANQNSIEEED